MSNTCRTPTRARSSFLYCEYPQAQRSVLSLYAQKARQASYCDSSKGFDFSSVRRILNVEPPRNRWSRSFNMSEFCELRGQSRRRLSWNATQEGCTPKSQKRMSDQRSFNESNSRRVLHPSYDVSSII